MPKPIIVIYHDSTLSLFEIHDIQRKLESKPISQEYFILFCPSGKYDIKVFYEKDFDQVRYEELKSIIEKSIQK